MKVSAIIPAAGKGKRLGAKLPKALFPVLGKPLLIHTVTRLAECYRFSEIIVASPPEKVKVFKRLFKKHGLNRVTVVPGGQTRAQSVREALGALSGDCQWVLVHDAARPLVTKTLIDSLMAQAVKTKAVISALPATSTVKRINPGKKVIMETVDRALFWMAQTPQVFEKKLLLERYRKLGKKAFAATDEAALFDGSETRVSVVAGDAQNIKITTKEDVELFEFYLRKKKCL